MPKFLVTTSKGLENLLADELQSFGIEDCKLSVSSVWCDTSLESIYRFAYNTRLTNRILLQLGFALGTNKDALYELARDIDWQMIFSSKQSFAIDFVGVNDALRNTQFSAQVIKDGICDYFVDEGSRRPNVDKQDADIRFQGRVIRNELHIFLDFSGSSLHERGYRAKSGYAPLKENLAAGIIMRSGWLKDTSQPLCDFFCGSGTLLIEAAQMALGVPSQQHKQNWGFRNWIGHNQTLFAKIRDEYDDAQDEIQANVDLKLFGSDVASREIKTAQNNAHKADVSQYIEFLQADVLSEQVNNKWQEPGHIIVNPPYGERLQETTQIANLYYDFGRKLKQQFANWRLSMITSAVDALRLLKLSPDKKYKINNARLDCVLATYEIEPLRDEATGDGRDQIATDFQNRLRKNIKKIKGYIKQADTECYRVYDADLPDYKVAIDIYDQHLVIQEYAPPKTIPEHVAKGRLNDVLMTAPHVLGISPANVHLKVRQQQKGTTQYQKSEERNEPMVVREGPAKFLVNLDDYLDTGLFMDHREVRKLVYQESKGKRVLNLFSYTCSVSVYAALGGAQQTVSVDLSNTYLRWGQDNFDLNDINGRWHSFERGDCMEWLMQERSNFDLIFIDPPTFSNSKRMNDIFDVQRDHVQLLKLSLDRLNRGGQIIFSNNMRRFKLDEEALEDLGLSWNNISEKTLPADFKQGGLIRQCWQITRK